ncbi:hypothetical protein WICPIJ_007805 [Wickerhamomyces pijperi]|uniref:Uncharacterized protein n=1 Tax=Wickerhamomyces pijperi TaxID=599730 RepID=A0A9P8Q0Y6_WICPI|nr:hypothetical protein WICPIJ_007805 [Wickerhamomyces pijperi]
MFCTTNQPPNLDFFSNSLIAISRDSLEPKATTSNSTEPVEELARALTLKVGSNPGEVPMTIGVEADVELTMSSREYFDLKRDSPPLTEDESRTFLHNWTIHESKSLESDITA